MSHSSLLSCDTVANKEVKEMHSGNVVPVGTTSLSEYNFIIIGKELADDAQSREANSTNSSTGSNNVTRGDELTDESSSSPGHGKNLQPKSPSVGYIYKFHGEIPQGQLRYQLQRLNNLIIAQAGPSESIAESVLRAKRKYTPAMISNEIGIFGFDQNTFSEACEFLVHDVKELELFLDMPPKFRRGWIMKRVAKRKDLGMEDLPIKKRKRNML